MLRSLLKKFPHLHLASCLAPDAMHCVCSVELMHLHDGHVEGVVQIAQMGVPWLGATCMSFGTQLHSVWQCAMHIASMHNSGLVQIGTQVWQNAYASMQFYL